MRAGQRQASLIGHYLPVADLKLQAHSRRLSAVRLIHWKPARFRRSAAAFTAINHAAPQRLKLFAGTKNNVVETVNRDRSGRDLPAFSEAAVQIRGHKEIAGQRSVPPRYSRYRSASTSKAKAAEGCRRLG